MKSINKKMPLIIILVVFAIICFIGLSFPYKQTIVAQHTLSGYELEQLSWFRHEAEGGNVDFQYKLARFLSGYSELTQVNYNKVIDYTEAVEWFRKSAEQGDVQAQYHLAVCYLTGRGVYRNIPMAIKLFCIDRNNRSYVISDFVCILSGGFLWAVFKKRKKGRKRGPTPFWGRYLF